jgi:ACS family hexuronate transporter-like MFS transporter
VRQRSNQDRASASDSYRWLVCALLFFATTINYVDRQILSLLKEVLDRQIGWTNEQFGWVNSAFQLAYGVGLGGFGWFVDRFGPKIGYAVSIVAWSLAAAAHSLAGSFSAFIGARAALGLGEAGNFPSAIKAVALWFSREERAFATSLFNAGTNVGALIAPAVVPWIALCWGWQAAFVAAGAAGLIWLGLWIGLYRRPTAPEDEQEARDASGQQFSAPNLKSTKAATKVAPGAYGWASLLAYRQTWSFVIAKFLTDPVWWFFLIWLPDYFRQTRGLDIKHSWVHLVTIYGIVTVLSIAGGWVTGFLASKGWSVTRARKTGMFCFALCVLPILLVTQVGDWMAVLLIGLAGAAHQAWSANLFTTVSDMFPHPAVASVVGLGGMAGSAGGFIFPIITGKLLDHFGRLHNVTAGYGILFGICSVSYVLAFVLNHLCAPRFEPLPRRRADCSS